MSTARIAYDDKLERILRIAAEVFSEKGYHRASIRDISRATGVSLSGLYYYVDSKEELLYRIQEHGFGTLLANLDELLAGVTDPHRKLRLLVENHLRYFVGNMKEMKVLSHEAESLTGDMREAVDAMKRSYSRIAKEILAELSAGEPAIDLRVATYSLFGMMNWIYNWYHPDLDVAVEELAEDIHRLFLRGFIGREDADMPPGAAEAAPGDTRPSIWRR
ncbi:MAG TPA: TetR/AcrR family transcriptional regulator [Longimicrobiales bacterium]|nr:TetR/AcrR family transcriptional regulator [Longimicrobiales bacterium]